MRITNHHKRAFIAAAVGIKEIEHMIRLDFWIEFPTRSLQHILDEYHTYIEQEEWEWEWVERPPEK